MTRTTRLAAFAVSIAFVAATGVSADAKTKHHHVRRHLDAYAQATHQESDMQIRQECYAQANKRWSSSNQDLQKVREFAYSTCAFDRGVYNP